MTSLLRLFAAAIVLAIAACGPRSAPAPADDLSAAEAGAVALVEEWARAGTENRWSYLPALFADEPGLVWVEQGVVRYREHAAVVTGATRAAATGLTVRTTVSEVQATALAADAALVRANVRIAFGADGAGFAMLGVLTGVAVKRGERWVFLQGHISSPAPPPSPTPTRATP